MPKGTVARIGTTRFRHGGWILAVAVSPDGKVIAAGGWGSQISLWDSRTGKEVSILDLEGASSVVSLSFSPNGKFLAARTQDKFAEVWEIRGKQHLRLELQDYGVLGTIRFSPNDQLLAVTSGENLRLWETDTWKELPPLHGSGMYCGWFAFSCDSRHLVSGGGQVVRLWDICSGKEVFQFLAHGTTVLAGDYSPDGKWVATVDRDGTVILWEAATGKVYARTSVVQPPRSWRLRLNLRFCPDGTSLAVSGAGLALLDLSTLRPARRFIELDSDIHEIEFSPDGKTFVYSVGQAVYLHDLANNRAISGSSGNAFPATSVTFSPDGTQFAFVGGGDLVPRKEEIIVYGARSFRELRRLGDGLVDMDRVTYSPDGKLLISEGERSFCMWDAATGLPTVGWQSYPPIRLSRRDVHDLVSPNWRLVLTWMNSRANYNALHRRFPWDISIWDIATHEELTRFEVPDLVPWSARVSPDERMIVFTFIHGPARLFDLAAGTLVSEVGDHVGWADFSPDGRTLLWTDENGKLHAWDRASHQERFQLVPAASELRRFTVPPSGLGDRPYPGFTVSSDGHLIALWLAGSVIYLFDLDSGEELGQLSGHTHPVSNAAFSPDAQLLVSSSLDTTVLVWDLHSMGKRERPAGTPGVAKLDAFWKALGNRDAAEAHRVMMVLAATPDQSVPYLAHHLEPAQGIEPRRLKQLLLDLDADEYTARERATRELDMLADLTAPALRDALASHPSAEVRRRLEQILQRQADGTWDPESLRILRAIEILERIGTSEARSVLERLAGGAKGNRLTEEARGSVERLGRRGAK